MFSQVVICLAIGLHVGFAGPLHGPTCGGNLPESAGSFQTPGYPIIYPDNLNCTWTIEKPNKPSILEFLDFEIEEALTGKRCQFDYVFVTIGGGISAQKIGPLCGYTLPEKIYFNESVSINFISDRIRAYKGFVAVYYPEESTQKPSTPMPETTTTQHPMNTTRTPYHCGGELTKPEGHIESPNYPQEYPDDLGCSWTIPKPSVPSILRFKDFDVEEANWGERCQFDYLYVFVGTGTMVKSYGPYCGTKHPKFITYNDEVQVTFTTDNSVTRKGFYLTYGPDLRE